MKVFSVFLLLAVSGFSWANGPLLEYRHLNFECKVYSDHAQINKTVGDITIKKTKKFQLQGVEAAIEKAFVESNGETFEARHTAYRYVSDDPHDSRNTHFSLDSRNGRQSLSLVFITNEACEIPGRQ